MSRSPDDLCPRIRGPAGMFIMDLSVQKIPIYIVDTLRTDAEHAANLKSGASQAKRSKHLAQLDCPACRDLLNSTGTRGLSHAIDVCPISQFTLHGATKLQWDTSDPAWPLIGAAIERRGLRWGGRWTTLKDFAHAEVPNGG